MPDLEEDNDKVEEEGEDETNEFEDIDWSWFFMNYEYCNILFIKN